MKKITVLLIGVLSAVIFSAVVYANVIYIEATKVQYPIVVDNIVIEQDFPMVSIDDRIYLPLRALCDVLSIQIDWKEEGKVEITTNKGEESKKDYKISQDMALEIADIVFTEKFGPDFVKNTNISIETVDGAYKVYRYLDAPVAGGDGIIYIGKEDGRIIDIIAGE